MTWRVYELPLGGIRIAGKSAQEAAELIGEILFEASRSRTHELIVSEPSAADMDEIASNTEGPIDPEERENALLRRSH